MVSYIDDTYQSVIKYMMSLGGVCRLHKVIRFLMSQKNVDRAAAMEMIEKMALDGIFLTSWDFNQDIITLGLTRRRERINS